MSPPFGTIEWCPILGDISGFLAVLRFLYVIKKCKSDQKGVVLP